MEPENGSQDLPYTNRELRERWHDLNNSISELSIGMSNGFHEVKTKQDSTNGRIKDLELTRARQDGFNKAFAYFGTVGWSVVVSLVGWMIFQILSIDSRVQAAVATSLSAYEIQLHD